MEPRLESSWSANPSPFPADMVDLITDAVSEKYAEEINGRSVLVQGAIYPEELIFRISFSEDSKQRNMNFEVSVAYFPEKEKVLPIIENALDVVDLEIARYFENRDEYEAPLYWTSNQSKKSRPIFFQVSHHSVELEIEAQKWLKEHDPELNKTH